MKDLTPPPGRPLSEAHRKLIALLAEHVVTDFFHEQADAPPPDTLPLMGFSDE